jgi:hypothetical protein
MTYYLLPQTNSNGLYEDHTDPLGLSLTDYISKLAPREASSGYSSYVPKSPYFFIMAELIRMHNLPVKDSLHIGTRSCLEYLEYIKTSGVHIDEGASGKYALLVDDTCELNLNVLSHQEQYGTYISRMNESTSAEAIQFLYKLCCCYKHVYLCKPDADCSTKSTKYVVAVHYKQAPDMNNLRISYYFRMKLEEINSVFGQSQLEHLRFMEAKLKNMDWCLKV